MINFRSLLNPSQKELQSLLRRFLQPLLLFLSLGFFIAIAVNAVLNLNQVQHLKIAAGLKDGESYLLAQALAKAVAYYPAQPRMQIDVLETPGTKENLQALSSNQVQLATAQADIAAPASARLVALLFPDVYQLIATKESGIKTVADLQGKRVGLPPKGGGQYQSFQFLVKHYDLNPDDPHFISMRDDQAIDDAFRKKEVDAVFQVRSAGNLAILKLLQETQGQMVPIDQAAALELENPALTPTTIPTGTYQGRPPIPITDLPAVAVQRLLLAGKDVDSKLIKRVTEILYERRQYLINQENLGFAAHISPPGSTGIGIPLHPGAQNYYDRTQPSFWDQHASAFDLSLSVLILMGSWFWQLKVRIEQQQRMKAEDYIREAMALLSASDCIKEVISLVSTAVAKSDEEIDKAVASISEKLGKAIADQEKAVLNYQKRKISLGSLQSFKVALQLMQSAVVWAVNLANAPNSTSVSKIKPALDRVSQQSSTTQVRTTSTESYQTFKARMTQEIHCALDIIFRRAVDALVEERVSSESFQSFRIIFQMVTSEIGDPEGVSPRISILN